MSTAINEPPNVLFVLTDQQRPEWVGMTDVLETDDVIERIEVEPHTDEVAAVSLDGSVRLLVDGAAVDGSDNPVFYRGTDIVARVEVRGAPLEVPHLVLGAIADGERGVWE